MAEPDFRRALAAFAQTATGMLQGQAAAETERRRRQLEQEDRVRQFHSTLLQLAPQLDQGSRETLFGRVLQQQGNIAQGRPLDYVEPSQINAATYRGPLGGGQPLTPSPAEAPAPAEPRQALGPLMTLPLPLPGLPSPDAGDTMGTVPVPFTVPLGQPSPPSPPRAAAPKPVAAPAPSAKKPPGFEVPGIGRLSFRGVDPKEAKGVLDAISKSRERAFSQAFVKDPAVQANLRGILSRVPQKPVDQWSEEEFAQAKQAQADFDSAVLFLGRQNPQIQMDLDRAEVGQIEKDIPKLSGFRADNLQQELFRLLDRSRGLQERGLVQIPAALAANLDDIQLMRDSLARGDKQQAGLVLGLVRTELTPKPKDADPYKALDRLLVQAPRWAGLDPQAQQVFIRRARQAAQDAGLDPSVIPDRIDAVMSEEARKRLGISSGQLALAQKREKRQAEEQAWRRGFDVRKERRMERQARLAQAAKEGQLTQQERARVTELQKKRDNLEQRLKTLQDKYFTDIDVGGENPMKARATSIEQEIDTIDGQIGAIINKRRLAGGGAGGAKTKTDREKTTGELMKELLEVTK